MMSYGTPGNITKKRLRVKRGALPNMDLDSTYSYDNEGRNTSMQYPSTWNGSSWTAGPNIGVEFNAKGQLTKLKNLTTSTDIISGATYNLLGEMLTMTGAGGAPSETRTYNSIGQMKQLQSGSLNLQYNFSATNNNGKIASETDVVSGETVTYTYDSLNRLATATSSTPAWGQSFGYDGFGNLTTVATTKGSAPNLSVTYSAATNRRTTDISFANSNKPVAN